MRVTVERLRRWILFGFVALTVVIISILGVARYKAKRFFRDLPKQLGADIRSETNGFTYSQSVKGRTVFTIHAARAVQRENNITTLHDVSILLYGQPTAGQPQRIDYISGSQFEYDQTNGIVRAVGDVHIDLQTPTQQTPTQPGETPATTPPSPPVGTGKPGEDKDGRIHLKTSGLVFVQKLGVAATEAPIEFHLKGAEGNAVGAEYESSSGLLILRHDVKLRRHGPHDISHFAASYAEINRTQHIASLRDASYQEDGRTLSSSIAFIDLRDDGSPQRLRAESNVVLTDQDERLTANHAVADISVARKLSHAHLTGDVKWNGSLGEGSASEADLATDSNGNASLATLHGDARITQHEGDETRSLSADRVEVALTTINKKVTAKEVRAFDHARFDLHAKDEQSTLSADTLTGTLALVANKLALRDITGNGHTVVDEALADGSTRHSVGDTFHATLANNTVQHATQEGHVVITAHTTADARRKRQASEMHAGAARVDFDGAAGSAVLTGLPHVEGDGMGLTAAHLVLARASGDATADGDVRASYSNNSPQGPIHITAAHAELHRATDTALFTGNRARIWQGASQLEAPRIELERTAQILRAHSDGKSNVRLILPASNTTKTVGDSGKKNNAGAAIITGDDLIYRGADALKPETQPTAKLTGHVTSQSKDGTLHADSLTAAWSNRARAAKPSETSKQQDLFSGDLQTLLAEGHVQIRQQGREGDGERLLYTTATREFELTGTPLAPPRVKDAVQGTVTGDALRFKAGEDSIVVAAAPGKRVHAESRVER